MRRYNRNVERSLEPAETQNLLKGFTKREKFVRKAFTEQIRMKLREMDEEETVPTCATKLGSLSQEGIAQVLASMVCQVCNRVPSPYKRFLCDAGHIFCEFCGEDRCVNHGAKCLMEITDEDKPCKKNEVLTAALEPMSLTCGPWNPVPKEPDFPMCQNEIRLYPADPIFTAFWMSSTWKCPLRNGACNTAVMGFDLFTHVAECTERMSQSSIECGSIGCALNGCKIEVSNIDDLIKHLIEQHEIDAMDLRDDDDCNNNRLWRSGRYGLLYIPQSFIEERKPYYTIVRHRCKFFLLCMEPASVNSTDMGFWIKLISDEKEKDIFSTYDLFMMNKYSSLRMTYRNDCLPWSKKTKDVFEDAECLALPTSILLDQLVMSCESEKLSSCDTEDEKGFLPVNFRIFVWEVNKPVEDGLGQGQCENDGDKVNTALIEGLESDDDDTYTDTTSTEESLPNSSDVETVVSTDSDAISEEEVDQDDDSDHKCLWKNWLNDNVGKGIKEPDEVLEQDEQSKPRTCC